MGEFQYRVSNALLSKDGLPGVTYKLDIGSDSIYVGTAWLDGKIVRIDITLSRGSHDTYPPSLGVADLEMQLLDLARCSVENSCRQASRLIELGEDIGSITSAWRGVAGFPHGICKQLRSIVPGPLHAAAVLIDENMDRWTEMFQLN
jgi:hypothetical protein